MSPLGPEPLGFGVGEAVVPVPFAHPGRREGFEWGLILPGRRCLTAWQAGR